MLICSNWDLMTGKLFRWRRMGWVWTLCLVTAMPLAAQTSGYASADGVLLRYWIVGEGPPLLIINGGPAYPSHHFTPVAEALSEAHRVILFDQRGTGQSTLTRFDSTTVNIAAMVADLEALREHLGYEAWTVMGHSWGGMLAMLYAAAHPERLRALILSASGGMDLRFLEHLPANIRVRLTPNERREYDRLMAHAETVLDPQDSRALRIQAMAPAYVYDRQHVPRVISALTEVSMFVPEVNQLVWQDLARTRYDVRAPMRRFRQPVLVVQGREDFLGPEVAEALTQTFPQSELVWIEACSHYPWFDQPERYFNRIQAFLRKLS